MQLFLCYRRADSGSATEQLRDWLETLVGVGHVFMDVYDITLAVNWRKEVALKIKASKAVLVIIGQHWAGPHLNDPNNATRYEIELALYEHIPIIPVLVEGGHMPSNKDLPPSLADLAPINAPLVHVGPERTADRERLRQAIEQVTKQRLHTSSQTSQQVLRTALIHRVRSQIREGLHAGLHDLMEIELGLTARPGIIDPPWGHVNPLNPLLQSALPAGETIFTLFTQHPSLVILGEPGAGKTTLLLSLANEVLQHVSDDATQAAAIPVILNLNTWALSHQTIPDWLTERLQLDYHFTKKQSQQIVAHLRLVVMADGIDEVAKSQRVDCIKALNAYLTASEQHHPLAITCRVAEFEALYHDEARLGVETAIQVQPLSTDQVGRFLAQDTSALTGVYEAINNDAGLAELVHTPLWLNLIAITYLNQADQRIPQDLPLEELKQHLFAAYVASRLDPQWRPRLHRPPPQQSKSSSSTKEALIVEYHPDQANRWLAWLSRQMQIRSLTRFYLEAMQPDMATHPGRLIMQSSTITLRDHLTFSQNRLARGLFIGLTSGLLLGVFSGLPLGLLAGPTIGLINGLFLGLVGGIFFSLRFGRLLGVSSPLETSGYQTPNLGIKRTGINGLFVGITVGPAIGLFVWILLRPLPDDGHFGKLIIELLLGIFLGLYSGLSLGIGTYLQHWILRLILTHEGAIPYRYATFLIYASQRNILRQRGNGFEFIHPLLRDYFASLGNTNSDASKRVDF